VYHDTIIQICEGRHLSSNVKVPELFVYYTSKRHGRARADESLSLCFSALLLLLWIIRTGLKKTLFPSTFYAPTLQAIKYGIE
jgi:hypothetical protein